MLHVDVYGKGPDLLLVHGWGMHGGMFSQWARQLGASFRVTVVDLPGHGNSAYAGERELAAWADAVVEVAPARAAWLGWSLGGLVALAAAATAPQRVQALVLLASTPKFVADRDWPDAVDGAVLEQFSSQLQADSQRTLGRFLALQIHACANTNQTLRQMRAELGHRPPAVKDALAAGLELLLHSDQRAALGSLQIPLFGLFGERDTLVPVEITDRLPELQAVILQGAGHVPFVSHAGQCTWQLRHWLLNEAVGYHAAN